MKFLVYFFVVLVLLMNCKKEVIAEETVSAVEGASKIEDVKQIDTSVSLHDKITIVGEIDGHEEDPIKSSMKIVLSRAGFGGEYTRVGDEIKSYESNPGISISYKKKTISFFEVTHYSPSYDFPYDSITFDFEKNYISLYEADGALIVTLELVDENHFRVHEYAGWLRHGEGAKEREENRTKEELYNDVEVLLSFARGNYEDKTRLYYFQLPVAR